MHDALTCMCHVENTSSLLMSEHWHHKHNCCTGTSQGNLTVAASSSSLFDVTMAELAHVLLPQFPPAKKFTKFPERKPEWLVKQRALWLQTQVQQAYCGLTPAGCAVTPLKHIADVVVATGSTLDVQVMLGRLC